HAGRRRYGKAFEALDRFVGQGGVLRSAADRLAARKVFDHVLDLDEVAGDDATREVYLRRYLLLRYKELAQRIWRPDPKDGRSTLPRVLSQLLELKDNEDFAAALGPSDAILMVHTAGD